MNSLQRTRTWLSAFGFIVSAATVAQAQLSTSTCNLGPGNPPACNAVHGDRSEGWLVQGRSEVMGRNGVVATSQPLAAQAGLEILRKGGNAVDAAVATAAVLNLIEPMNVGMGGDLFAIIYTAKDHKLHVLNASGKAPSGTAHLEPTGTCAHRSALPSPARMASAIARSDTVGHRGLNDGMGLACGRLRTGRVSTF